MKKKELIRKGLLVLISSAILMTGCASKENSTAPVTSQTENESTQTENNSQDIADKTTKDDSQKMDNESLKDDSQKMDIESPKDDSQKTDAEKPENNSNTEDKEDSQESKSDVSDSAKIENEENEEAGGNKETEEENEEVTFTDINSGPIYEAIQSIDPDLQVQDANSGEYLAITMDKSDDDKKDIIHRFFWDTVQLLKTEIFKDTYDSIRFTLLSDDCFESFGVSKFENFDNFMTSYIGPLSQNEDVKKYFPLYYNTIFATKDTSLYTTNSMYDTSKKHETNYELPDNFQEGHLWFYSNFNYDCKMSIRHSDNAVTVTIPVEDTVESGTNIGEQVFSALETFYTLSYNKPVSFPYNSLKISCIDYSAKKTLWTYISDKSSGDWEVKKNEALGYFFIGLKGNNTSETSDNSSQQENLENESQSPQDNNFQQQTSDSYVLNTSTMKIHRPSCSTAKKISSENYATSNSSISELESQGYSRCGICLK